MTTQHHKVLILGSGAAGLTAAIYTARAGMKPTLIHGMQPGGQMTITTDVENFPGFPEVIQGPWLMEQMQAQAESVGTNMISDIIVEADLQNRPFTLTGDSGDIYTCDSLIVCTGAQAKWLGMESEEKYQGFGVSACATCDGFFYRGKEVAVVGGGNTAVEEAIYLTNHATKVKLIHRRDELRAEKMLQERLFNNPKIEMLWDSALEEVVGKDDGPMPEVTGMRVKNVKTGDITDHSLEEGGLIKGYHADLEPTVLGYNVTVFAQVGLTSQAEPDLVAFEALITSWPEVRECHMLAGETDFLLKIVAEDWETYQAFVMKKLTAAPNVAHVKSSLAIRASKADPGVPVRIFDEEDHGEN